MTLESRKIKETVKSPSAVKEICCSQKCQGSSCMEAQKGYCVKLWRESPYYTREFKMFELPDRSTNRVWKHPMIEKWFLVSKAERSWSALTVGMEMQNLELALSVFCLHLVQYFPTMFPSLPFRKVMYILYYWELEVNYLLFDFHFSGDYNWYIMRNLRRDFGLLSDEEMSMSRSAYRRYSSDTRPGFTFWNHRGYPSDISPPVSPHLLQQGHAF